VHIKLEPLRVVLQLEKSVVKIGTRTQAVARVTNVGATKIGNVTALLQTQSHLVVVPGGSQALGTLSPGATVRVAWTVCATAASTYVVTAKASGTTPASAVLDYARAALQASGSSRTRC
jgi:hypothetical protein